MSSDVRESMKRVKKVFSCEERVMYEGSCTTFNKVKIQKISENSKNLVSMTKKRSSEMFAAKMEIFSEKSSWSAKNFSVPPNSAPGFRHCSRASFLLTTALT